MHAPGQQASHSRSRSRAGSGRSGRPGRSPVTAQCLESLGPRRGWALGEAGGFIHEGGLLKKTQVRFRSQTQAGNTIQARRMLAVPDFPGEQGAAGPGEARGAGGFWGPPRTDGLGRADRRVPVKGFLEETPTRASRDPVPPGSRAVSSAAGQRGREAAASGRFPQNWSSYKSDPRPQEGRRNPRLRGVPACRALSGVRGGERGPLLPPGVRAARGVAASSSRSARGASPVLGPGQQRGHPPWPAPPTGRPAGRA